MKTRNIQSELADGFDVGAMPAPAADGTMSGPPRALRAPTAPRLCELGPCRNYHRLVTQTEGQTYQDGTESLNTQTSHSCYPSSGIEVELGAVPILECNRWAPSDVRDSANTMVARIRRSVLDSTEGQRFTNELFAWHNLREKQNLALEEGSRVAEVIETKLARCTVRVRAGTVLDEHRVYYPKCACGWTGGDYSDAAAANVSGVVHAQSCTKPSLPAEPTPLPDLATLPEGDD